MDDSPPAQTRYLIVNADDYGLSVGVSAGIRHAHQQGVVSSTSAMMNFPRAQVEVARAASECPDLGQGVHLVLSAGSPTRPASKVTSLVEADGRFPTIGTWVKDRWADADAGQLRDEWRTQIDLFVQAAGRTPTHLDSHHHLSYLHEKPLTVMLELAAEMKIPVRNPMRVEAASHATGSGGGDVGSVLDRLGEHWTATPRPAGLISNHLGTGRTIGDSLTAALPPGAVVEAMCHPGWCDADLKRLSSLTEARQQELDMLCRPALRRNLTKRGFVLVSFAAL